MCLVLEFGDTEGKDVIGISSSICMSYGGVMRLVLDYILAEAAAIGRRFCEQKRPICNSPVAFTAKKLLSSPQNKGVKLKAIS